MSWSPGGASMGGCDASIVSRSSWRSRGVRFWCTSMPSRPSPPSSREAPRTLVRTLSRGAALAALLALYGCASAKPPAPAVVLSTADAPYVVQPFDGYPLTVDHEREARVNSAWSALLAGADPRATLEIAQELLVGDPGFHPGQVLAAAAELVLREPDAIVRSLTGAGRAARLHRIRPAARQSRAQQGRRRVRGVRGAEFVRGGTGGSAVADAVRELAGRVDDALRNHVEDANAAPPDASLAAGRAHPA